MGGWPGAGHGANPVEAGGKREMQREAWGGGPASPVPGEEARAEALLINLQPKGRFLR